jgi:predicted Zn-dependent protease
MFAAAAVAAAPVGAPVRAQQGGGPQLPIIRDAEMETLMRDYAQPVLRAASLAQQNVKVVVLNER